MDANRPATRAVAGSSGSDIAARPSHGLPAGDHFSSSTMAVTPEERDRGRHSVGDFHMPVGGSGGVTSLFDLNASTVPGIAGRSGLAGFSVRLPHTPCSFHCDP
ncbi:hypothetical protein [Streptosporangium roseum]|uniref:hypothetical protein n=1 Tax=Streptosporangium roseum TaxID=2001 RepID=UPI0033188C1F